MEMVADETEKAQRRTLSWRTRFKAIAALSRGLLETADSLRRPFPLIALKLRQAYADAAGQGTVVWRLPGTKKGAEEINELLNQIDQYEKEIAH
jgi:hypothetical protein